MTALETLWKERIAEQETLTQITAPQTPDTYAKTLEKYGQHRGAPLWYPYLGSGLGNKAFVQLQDGSVKYDLINGIGVHGFGHGNPDLLKAQIKGSLEDVCMQGNLQQNSISSQLAETMIHSINQKGAQLDHVFFSTSGAMANENALKIALQHRKASRLLAFSNNFAGRSMAMASLSDKPQYRKDIPLALEVDYIPFFDANNPEESTTLAIKSLKEYIKRFPNQHGAMIFELVQGEGGFYPGEHHFFKTLMEILHEKGVLVWVDEIQTFARTPELFAFQFFQLDQWIDLVTIGKFSQVCATFFKEEHKPAPGLISQTFTSSSVALHTSYEIFKKFESGSYFGSNGQIFHLHSLMLQHLTQRKLPIQGPYGIGTMFAFQIFDGSLEKVQEFLKAIFQQGIIAFANGANPYRIRFLLPLDCLEEKDIIIICDLIEEQLQKM